MAIAQRVIAAVQRGIDVLRDSEIDKSTAFSEASRIAHFATDNDLTLKAAALKLGFVTEDEFDRCVDPSKMVHAYVASSTDGAASSPKAAAA